MIAAADHAVHTAIGIAYAAAFGSIVAYRGVTARRVATAGGNGEDSVPPGPEAARAAGIAQCASISFVVAAAVLVALTAAGYPAS